MVDDQFEQINSSMPETGSGVKAVGLCSGGLDSILAGLVLREQGIDVLWVSFETPFFSAQNARKASRMTGIPLVVVNLTEKYLPMLKNPPAGYGKAMNPCMDCHALMFAEAGRIMERTGADFLFSGEVLGQRPKSQVKSSLRYVEKRSGYDGRILRPLSALKLPETEMEKRGLVDRSRLYGFSGRSRKPQIDLARKFGVSDYPPPAGGCLLTDKGFAKRLADLLARRPDPDIRELEMLKLGRHLEIDKCTRIVVGRNKNENQAIIKLYNVELDTLFTMVDTPGPVGVITGKADQDALLQGAVICASYSKVVYGKPVRVGIVHPGGTKQEVTVMPVLVSELQDRLIP